MTGDPHRSIASFADAVMASSVAPLAIYVFGSVAEGTALPTSDIDLFIVLGGGPDERQRAAAATVLREIASRFDGPPIDLVVASEADLLRDGHFRLERASQLIVGEDLRPALPPMTVDRFIAHYREAPLAYMTIFRPGLSLDPPLDYPDPAGTYYGYDRTTLPPAGIPAHNIKAFVALGCWIATVRLARERGIMAASKAESVAAYASAIADDWAPFVTDLYRLGHDRWSYLVPDEPAEREALRDLCRRMLAFENDFVTRDA
jgi:predicted nucleotidyltransferase